MCESSYVHANGMNNQRIKSRLHVEEKPLFSVSCSAKKEQCVRHVPTPKIRQQKSCVSFSRKPFEVQKLEIHPTNVSTNNFNFRILNFESGRICILSCPAKALNLFCTWT